jgi:hypothetical protein
LSNLKRRRIVQRHYEVDSQADVAASKVASEVVAAAAAARNREDGDEGEVDHASSPWRQASALALLNGVTLVWGTQHAVIKLAIDTPAGSPAILTLARFGLAALLFAPWLPRPSTSSSSAPTGPAALEAPSVSRTNGGIAAAVPPPSSVAWRAGAELGCWMFAGYALQAVRRPYGDARQCARVVDIESFSVLNSQIVPTNFFQHYMCVLLGGAGDDHGKQICVPPLLERETRPGVQVRAVGLSCSDHACVVISPVVVGG